MAEVALSSCGDAAGTPRKRSREPPGSCSEFQTPVTKRLRAAPGSPKSPKNSQNSSSEEEEKQEKEILPRRLEIPAGNSGIPQNSQFPVGAFYGKRLYLDPLERKRLRELLGEGKFPEKIGNSDKNLGNSGRILGNSGRNPGNSGRNLGNSNRNCGSAGKNLKNSGKNSGNSGKNFGNSGRNLGNSSRNLGNSGRNLGNSSRNLGNSGRSFGNSCKNPGNSTKNPGNSTKNPGNSGWNCSSKGKGNPKDGQEIPKGENKGNVGNCGNVKSGNSSFRVLSVGVRPPLRLPLGSSFFLSGKKSRKKSQKNPGEPGKNPPENSEGKENREWSKGKEEIPRKNPLENSEGKENREWSKEEIPRKNPLEKSGKENKEYLEVEEEIPRKNPLEKSREGNQECSKEEIPRKNPLEKSGKEDPPGIPHPQDSLSPKKDSGSSCPAGLFPIFLPSRRRPLEELPAPFGPSGKAPKKSKDLNSWDQLIIDLGQRELGAGQCGSCGMVFAPGIPEDRLQHLRHHRRLREGLRYLGWKQQRVVAEFWDGKIVLILPGDPKYALRKAQEVLEVVDSELGFPGSSLGSLPENSRVYLFVGTGKCVLGCLVAEPIQQAFRVLPEPEPDPSALPAPQNSRGDSQNSRGDSQDSPRDPCLRAWRCSAVPEGAVCGVSRLWVLGPRRRRRIARRMADTLRHTFVFGAVLAPGDLAFSAPTGDGRAFAERYCGRPDFLVYSCLGNSATGSSVGSSMGSSAMGSSTGSSVGSSTGSSATGSSVGSS